MSNFRVQGQLALDGSSFMATLGRAQGAVGRFSSSVGNRLAAAFSVGAVTLFAKRTLDFADNINDVSQRLNVGVERLQEWQYAAEQTGASIETVTSVIEKLRKAQEEAASGGANARDALSVFGISTSDNTETAMAKLAAAARSGSAQSNASSFQQVAGRGGGALIPALKQWEELAQRARDVGAVMSEDQIAVFEKVKDQLSTFSKILMVQLAPALQFAIEKSIILAGAIKGAIGFVGGVAATPGAPKAFAKEVFSSDKLGDWLRGAMGLPERDTAVPEGYPLATATEAFDEAMKEATDLIESLRAAQANAVTEIGPPEPRAQKAGKLKTQSDSLVSIGNFLGSNASALNNIPKQQLEVMKNIERNTRPKTTGETIGVPPT